MLPRLLDHSPDGGGLYSGTVFKDLYSSQPKTTAIVGIHTTFLVGRFIITVECRSERGQMSMMSPNPVVAAHWSFVTVVRVRETRSRVDPVKWDAQPDRAAEF